ncbi:MAG: hypothetical protein KJ052_17775 [Candidatus Hydrogenedentes bacterium]|nr:hypothetical protein [Candidatus Hydrogenedentota bacterium]
MPKSARQVLVLTSFAVNIVGLVLLVRWLIQTDVMFDHYSGPPALIVTSMLLLAFGAISGIAWHVDGAIALARRQPDGPGKRFTKTGIAQGILLIPFILLSVLVVGLGIIQLSADIADKFDLTALPEEGGAGRGLVEWNGQCRGQPTSLDSRRMG